MSNEPRAITDLRALVSAAKTANELWLLDGGGERWSEDVGDRDLPRLLAAIDEIERFLGRWDRSR